MDLKRLTAILFLLLLLFNCYGYRLVFSYLETVSEEAWEEKLADNTYSEDELLSIKTSLHLPYYTGSEKYESAVGSININGIVYQYVKKRVYKDTLEVLCLPHIAKTKLKTFQNDLAKSSAGDDVSVPVKKNTSTVKILLPEFCQFTTVEDREQTPTETIFGLQHVPLYNFSFIQIIEQPPQA